MLSVILEQLTIINNQLLFDFSPDCEAMGGSNEFFDKFSTRYHISVILRKFWDSSLHRMAIAESSR